MPRQVIVIGAGQGGLAAAIHLRLRGWDVLVLERSMQCGGKAARVSMAGFTFDPGPSIIILKRLYEAVFRDSGRRPEDYLWFRRLDPISRVCFEGMPTIDLPAEPSGLRDVLREVAPEDIGAFDQLLDTLDKVSPLIDRSIFKKPYLRASQLADPNLVRTALHFDVRKSYKALVDGMFRSPLLRSFFYGFPSYGGQTYDSKAPGALMIPYLMVREGVWWPEGGVSQIPGAFELLARNLGVEFRMGVTVTGLSHDARRVTRVETESGETFEADAIVANVDRFTVDGWLGVTHSEPPSLSYFTLQWGVSRDVPGLSHHTLLVPKDFERGFDELYRAGSFPTRPIVYLNATHLTDPLTAPPGSTNLFAVVTTPADTDAMAWQERSGEYRARVMDELTAHGFKIDESDIVCERVQTPRYFAQEHGNYRGSLYGPTEAARLWGLMPLSNRHDTLRNLFFAGGSVQPGAGLPMVTLSGRFAAELADKAIR
ncbi:MAG TPA: phytoene desaturase family protein [Fimbriimonadaceae bacterium]|nr:phytoene desaturase family protein [Fimbriimonadaceae bacterium]